jgi:predicted enzyme related to lactoylglutathione lyase
MTDSTILGRFVWYDLMTTDPSAAAAFYTRVAGWGTTEWQGPTPYTMWTVGGTPIGGVMTLPADAAAPPHWLGYIGAPDIEALVSRAVGHGGRMLVAPTDIPTVGRFAVLQDPQGAVFAVYTPSNPDTGGDGEPPVGHFSWHELATTDAAGAADFYIRLFGWEAMLEHDMGPMGTYRILGRNGRQLIGMFNRPPEMPGGPAWLYYVRTESADLAAERAAAEGGRVLNGPMDVPGGGRIAQCLDPQGGMFALHATPAQA